MKQHKSFQVIDHSVSKESFTLKYDKDLDMYATVPQPELEKLHRYYESEDYISHTNSQRNLFERVYHVVRSFMLGSKLNLLSKYSKEKGLLLDIGCGTGDFLLAAKNAGWKVTGIEPNAQARGLASTKLTQVFDVKHLPRLKEQSFDVITLWHVLEHLPKLEEQLEVVQRLIKQDGLLVIAVPNFKSYDAHYYKTNWAAFDVPRHLWHFSKFAVKSVLRQYDFELVKTKPMWFDALYVSMLSEKIKGSNLFFIKGMLMGLYSNFHGLLSNEYSSHIYILKKTRN